MGNIFNILYVKVLFKFIINALKK